VRTSALAASVSVGEEDCGDVAAGEGGFGDAVAVEAAAREVWDSHRRLVEESRGCHARLAGDPVRNRERVDERIAVKGLFVPFPVVASLACRAQFAQRPRSVGRRRECIIVARMEAK